MSTKEVLEREVSQNTRRCRREVLPENRLGTAVDDVVVEPSLQDRHAFLSNFTTFSNPNAPSRATQALNFRHAHSVPLDSTGSPLYFSGEGQTNISFSLFDSPR